MKHLPNSIMGKFILNKPDDYLSLSKKRIIVNTLKWFVILMAGAVLLRIVSIAIYMSMGVNPMELTKFGGDPTNYVGHATRKTLLRLMIVAPLAEYHAAPHEPERGSCETLRELQDYRLQGNSGVFRYRPGTSSCRFQYLYGSLIWIISGITILPSVG